MASVVINGDTSGSVTLSAPAVAGSTTLTLPTTSGTVLTSASSISGSTITGTQTIPRGTLPTGSVLQVVSATYSTLVSNSTTTFVDTGLTATITPTSATSKILILVGHPNSYRGPVNASMGIKLFRNATDLGKIIDQANYAGGNMFAVSFNYYDSPSSTSALVYKTQFNSEGTGQVNVQSNSYPSTITLMEIAA